MKNSTRRKLISSVVAASFTAVCLVSTTFAWFAKNQDAWTETFELNIGSDDTMQISIDGINYKDAITPQEVYKAITAKRLGKGVSELTAADIKTNFSLANVTTKDLVNFQKIDEFSSVVDGYYVPDTVTDNSSYIAFDLWFNVNSSSNDKEYTVSFATTSTSDANKVSEINSQSALIKLSGPLSTTTEDYGPGIIGTDGKAKDEIVVNPVDALRVGVMYEETKTQIYEPSIGLGSYATTSTTIDNLNCDKNAMYTYFNNTHADQMKPLEYDDVYKNTIKTLDDDSVKFGTIKAVNGKNQAVKITLFIWLEGYDADFFQGVAGIKTTAYFNFAVTQVTPQGGANNE